MNITVNAKTLEAALNDSASTKELIDFLNSIIDEELAKSNPDCDLIDECIDLIDELQEHKYTSPVLRVVLSANTIKKIVNPKRNSWSRLNRALRVAIIAAMIATGTFTVNAAVKSVTGIDFIGNITSAISSFIHNNDNGKKGELTGEVFVPVDETSTATATTAQIIEESTTKNALQTTTEKAASIAETTTEAEINNINHSLKTTTQNKKEVNTTEEREEPTDPYSNDSAPQLVGIRAEFEHFKTAYIYGEKLSYNGLKIFAKYSDNTEKSVPLDDCAYSKNLDMDVTADYTLSVTYKACTLTVGITVRPDEDTRLSDICSNDDWEYLKSEKGIYLTLYKGGNADVTVNAIDSKPVLAVTSKAFENSNIASFSSDSVKTVYQSAFENCASLNSCNIPNAETIGDNAFKDSSLQKITLGNNLSALGTATFENTNLGTLTLPENITAVPERLCNNCTSLKTVTLAGKVETVGDMAFYKCSKLTKVNGAKNLKNIGSNAFAENELMRFDTAPGVETVGEAGFANCKKANFGNIGASFKYLGAYAFDGCSGIKSITVPSDVQTVPAFCFNATGATSVTLQNGVKRIEQSAFRGLALQEITVPSSVEYIGEYALYSADMRTVTVKSQTVEIADNAFYLGRRVTFNVIENSTAHTFAVNNELNFNLIEED